MSSVLEPPEAVRKLVQQFARLPGIGEKTALRLAYFVLRQNTEYPRELAQALLALQSQVRWCDRCFALTEHSPCGNCLDARRDTGVLCVVERPMDVFSVERSGQFQGRYHVLHGVLSPLDGVGPEDLRIRELVERVGTESIREVILALNPSLEGETTCVFLTKKLAPLGVRVSQLASGIPVGGMIEYSDRHTLGRALSHRTELKP